MGRILALWLLAAVAWAHSSLTGRITDPQGKPVKGARVEISGGLWTESAADGSYQLHDTNPGKQTMTVTKPGFEPAKQTIELDHDIDSVIDVQLRKPRGK
jgi:protocatechuate 3,4-dioxygenase beta subunit